MIAEIITAVLVSVGGAADPQPDPIWVNECFDAQGNPSTTSQGGGYCITVDLREWAKTHPDICGRYFNEPCE